MSDSKTARIRISVSDPTGVILEKEFSDFPVTFGRNPASQVLLPFDFVSRSHCSIVEEDDGLVLVDMHSSHGVFVNEQKISRVKISGNFVFTIRNLSIKVTVLDEDGKADDTLKTFIPKNIFDSPVAGKVYTPKANPSAPTVVQSKPDSAMPRVKLSFNQPPENESSSIGDFKPIPDAKPMKIEPLKFSKKPVGRRIPMVDKDFHPILYGTNSQALGAQYRKVEATVSWHEVVYDTQEFDPGDKISIGPRGRAEIAVPIFRRPMNIAKVGKDKTKCFALKEHAVSLNRGSRTYGTNELLETQTLNQRGPLYTWTFDPQETTTIDFGAGISLHLRYVPGARALSRRKIIEPDEAFKQAVVGSSVLHLGLALIIFLFAPAAEKGPKIKNVPERYARLLVQKPKPKPTPPPPPVAKKEPPKEPPKPVEKVVKQKPIKTPKVIAKKNKFPMEVAHPIPKAPPPVKVEALGALGALGIMSKTAQPNVVQNININPNAGGLPQKAMNTGGIVGALPSSNGKLAAAGGPRVKTKGFGYGTGTGYGIQGLKGTAGTRGVAGAVVGEPKLAKMSREEGLSREQVMAVLKSYMGEVQHCYERNLLANPDLAGRIDFEWDISPSGRVTDVRVKRNTVNNGDGLVECVRKVFVSMNFPKAKNGLITTPSIGFPFGRI